MLRRLAHLLTRLAHDDVTTRAIWETVADAEYRANGARSRFARLTVGIVALFDMFRAVTRGLLSAGRDPVLRDVRSDFRYAFRRLWKTPVFTRRAHDTLALAIGTMTATYAVVRGVLGPPSGVRNADRILNVYHSKVGSSNRTRGFSLGDYEDFRARQTVFESVMAWHSFGAAFTADGQSAM